MSGHFYLSDVNMNLNLRKPLLVFCLLLEFQLESMISILITGDSIYGQCEQLMQMEKVDETDSSSDAWMIRPCEIYDDEYSDCKSFKARFHQYFVFGKFVDCSQWKHDYENCVRWRDNKNLKSCDELIKSEKKRRYERLMAHMGNDIWEKRDAPPEDWNKPLPEWMQQEYKDTYLAHKAKELEDPKVFKEPQRTFCVIS